MSTNQRRNCLRLRTTVLLPLTTPTFATSLLVLFLLSSLPTCASVVQVLLLLQLLQLLEDFHPDTFQVRLSACSSCPPSEFLVQMLNFFPECQAFPLQHNQHLRCSSHLAIRATGISSAPCLRKIWYSFFAFLTSRLPRNAFYVNAWLVWRQKLFLQLSGAYL